MKSVFRVMLISGLDVVLVVVIFIIILWGGWFVFLDYRLVYRGVGLRRWFEVFKFGIWVVGVGGGVL